MNKLLHSLCNKKQIYRDVKSSDLTDSSIVNSFAKKCIQTNEDRIKLKNGKHVHISFTNTLKPFVSYDDTKRVSVSNCMPQHQYPLLVYSDSFTNDLFVHYMLTSILSKNNMVPFTSRRIKCSYLSNISKGCFVEEPNSVENIMNNDIYNKKITYGDEVVTYFDIDTIWSLLNQLIIFYDFSSSRCDFKHGNAYIHNVHIYNQPIMIDYKGYVLESPFTIKINNFENSTITCEYNNTWLRFAPKDDVSSIHSDLFECKESIEDEYEIRNEFTDVLFTKNKLHKRFIHSSFDLYSMITSIFLHKKAFVSLKNNAELQVKIWNKLWKNDELLNMWNVFEENLSDEVTEKDVRNVLSQATLNKNILFYLLKAMKTDFISSH